MSVNVSQELAQAKAQVLTTDAVLIEAATTFSKVDWRSVAWQIIEAVQASAALKMSRFPKKSSEIF